MARKHMPPLRIAPEGELFGLRAIVKVGGGLGIVERFDEARVLVHDEDDSKVWWPTEQVELVCRFEPRGNDEPVYHRTDYNRKLATLRGLQDEARAAMLRRMG